MCAVPAEVHTALSNADAASADLMFMIAAVRSSLQTAAEQSNNDAEGAERSAAQMTARMPATARHSREDAVKWRPRAIIMTFGRARMRKAGFLGTQGAVI